MKSKLSILMTALFAAAIAMTACGKGSSDSSSSNAGSDSSSIDSDRFGDNDDYHLFGESESGGQDESSLIVEEITEAETTEYVEQSMSADENAVPSSGAAPVLAVSSVSGAPGETVNLTISISGADKKWSMCGVHVTYDERLICAASAEDPKTPEFEKGEAIENIGGFVSMIQAGEDRNDYLISNKLNAVFFAAVDSTNLGKDGDIVTYKFTIPEDAQSGTVYNIGFYYREGDMFLDQDHDEAMQDYAFSHWQEGSITVS